MDDINIESTKKYECKLKFLDTRKVSKVQTEEKTLIWFTGSEENRMSKRVFHLSLDDCEDLSPETIYKVVVTSHKGKETIRVYADEKSNTLIEV